MKKVDKFAKELLDKDVQAYVAMALAILREKLETEDLKELANATRLSLGTLYRLSYGICSAECRVSTLQKLAIASGLKLTFQKNGRGTLSTLK